MSTAELAPAADAPTEAAPSAARCCAGCSPPAAATSWPAGPSPGPCSPSSSSTRVSRRGLARRDLGRGHLVPEPRGGRAPRPHGGRHASGSGTASGTSGSSRTATPCRCRCDADTGRVTYSAWAFYPLYPYLVKASWSRGCRSPSPGSCSTSLLGAVAAVLVHALFRSTYHAARQPQRERLALVAACLWCFYPTTSVMLKPYTEALAVALVAGGAPRPRAAPVPRSSPPLAVPLGLHPRGRARPRHRGPHPPGRPVARGAGPPGWRRSRAARRRRGDARCPRGQRAWPGRSSPAVATGVPTAFFDVQAAWGQKPADGPFVLWVQWAWEAKGLSGCVVLVALAGDVRRPRARAARALAEPSRCGPGRWPTRSSSSPSSGRSPRCGASSCSTCRSPRSWRRWRCAPRTASRSCRTGSGVSGWSSLVLVGGIIVVDLQPPHVHPVGLASRRDLRGSDFVTSAALTR